MSKPEKEQLTCVVKETPGIYIVFHVPSSHFLRDEALVAQSIWPDGAEGTEFLPWGLGHGAESIFLFYDFLFCDLHVGEWFHNPFEGGGPKKRHAD